MEIASLGGADALLCGEAPENNSHGDRGGDEQNGERLLSGHTEAAGEEMNVYIKIQERLNEMFEEERKENLGGAKR